MESVSPSASVSFDSTLIVFAPLSSRIVGLSSTASGSVFVPAQLPVGHDLI
jgi:hypothetical protein